MYYVLSWARAVILCRVGEDVDLSSINNTIIIGEYTLWRGVMMHLVFRIAVWGSGDSDRLGLRRVFFGKGGAGEEARRGVQARSYYYTSTLT